MNPKTWLITGSSRGFGRELAKHALAIGDNVIATARKPEQLQDLVADHPESARALALDVTDRTAAEAAVRTAVEEFGSLDVVVNNAGYANISPIEAMTPDDFRGQIEANLFGLVNVTQAALPVLRRQGSGHFIQFSSIGGRVGGTPGLAAYQAAKFGVEGFSEVLANEIRPFGLKVTIVEPGAFRTDWAASAIDDVEVPDEYASLVGDMIAYFHAHNGKEAGDPVRAAKIIAEIVRSNEPPLRLLLGAGALQQAELASESRANEAQKWAATTLSADYPEHEE